MIVPRTCVGGTPNQALHRTAIPLCSIAAGELGRYVYRKG